MRTPTEEREVCAGAYTYKDDGTRNDKMTVYTSDYSFMAKFDKFCKENPDHWKLVDTMKQDGDIVGKRYECTWECILFRAKPKQGTPQTEEQKQAFVERMKALREMPKTE